MRAVAPLESLVPGMDSMSISGKESLDITKNQKLDVES